MCRKRLSRVASSARSVISASSDDLPVPGLPVTTASSVSPGSVIHCAEVIAAGGVRCVRPGRTPWPRGCRKATCLRRPVLGIDGEVATSGIKARVGEERWIAGESGFWRKSSDV